MPGRNSGAGPSGRAGEVESTYAWMRLLASVTLSTIGGIGLWSYVVVLPAVQADFGVDRASASLPYTVTMICFAAGGIIAGRMADRFGITVPVLFGALALGLGYAAAAFAPNLWLFAAAHGLLISMLGCAATFGPLIADVSQWFTRRRGIAVGICASGNYLAGTVWPPLIEPFVAAHGWRDTYLGIGAICVLAMPPLCLALRRRVPFDAAAAAAVAGGGRALALSPTAVQALLAIAGFACCTAMAMPQVHIVAYCGDLGYGVAAGTEMLALMLGFGVVSRLASGWISDRIGGVKTLLLGSVLQMATLLLYIPADGLTSLYVVSALFGLSQGGIVPSYAIIVREFFPSREAGTRVGVILMATILGMAVGGWMSGAIYDLTGSYRAAFVNGVLWNVLNAAVALWLLRSRGPRPAVA